MSNQSNFPSDDALLHVLRVGGTEVQQAKLDLIKKYDLLVKGIAGRILGPARCDHIEGVISDSRITILEKVATVRDPKALPGWLAKVVRRKAVKHLRKFHRNENVPLEEGQELSDNWMASPEREIEAAELIGRVRALARTITPPNLAKKFSKILDLLLDGLEIEEVALALNETPANIRNIYYRGLRKLKKLLGDDPGPGGGRP